jgi:hypothetical protein
MLHDAFESLLPAMRSTIACIVPLSMSVSLLGCGDDDDGAVTGSSTTDASTSTPGESTAEESGTSAGTSGIDATDDASTLADTSSSDESTSADSGGDAEAYGPAYAMDGLGNMQVGGPASGTSNVAVAYRFVAATSADLDAIRVYVVNQDHPGYGGGTGGTLRVALQGANAGFPDGVELAAFELASPDDSLQTWPFPEPPALVAGTTYHLVFTNVDPDPIANFISMNLTWVRDARSPRQPKWTDEEFGSARKFGDGPWSDATEQQYTPILELEYADRVRQGQGYMEISYGDGEYGIIRGTDRMVRESFAPSDRSRVVAGGHVRVMRDAGEDPGASRSPPWTCRSASSVARARTRSGSEAPSPRR